ncbi:MAG: phosphoadenylyl-sulfate reductase [Candidatus Binatia bacterium]
MAANPELPLSCEEIERLNEQFEDASPEQILGWAVTTFPEDSVLTCSFQHEGVILAHMLRTLKADVPVVFINTRFHFEETLRYRDTIVKLLDLDLREIQAELPFEEFKKDYGTDLYAKDPDLCCRINKVDPLKKALEGVKAWINGRRRNQTADRRHLSHVELSGSIIKINPLASWNSKDSYRYLHAHSIPLHPLFEKGYSSIGCESCTSLPVPGMDERSGRWAGSAKRECGIHTILDNAQEPTD